MSEAQGPASPPPAPPLPPAPAPVEVASAEDATEPVPAPPLGEEPPPAAPPEPPVTTASTLDPQPCATPTSAAMPTAARAARGEALMPAYYQIRPIRTTLRALHYRVAA